MTPEQVRFQLDEMSEAEADRQYATLFDLLNEHYGFHPAEHSMIPMTPQVFRTFIRSAFVSGMEASKRLGKPLKVG